MFRGGLVIGLKATASAVGLPDAGVDRNYVLHKYRVG